MTPHLLRSWSALPSIIYENFRGLPRQMQELAYGQETAAAAIHIKGDGLKFSDPDLAARRFAFVKHVVETGRIKPVEDVA